MILKYEIPKVKLAKNVQELYIGNYKTLLGDIKEGAINGEIYRVYGLQNVILMGCMFSPTLLIDSMQFPSK